MRTGAKWALFAIACLAQWGVAAREIVLHERTLRRGELFRFRAAPVDPVDAFRGRYVAVSLWENSVPRDGANIPRNTQVYVEPQNGEDSFAHFVRVHRKPPTNIPTLPARVLYADENHLHFVIPLDRYFLNERLAPEAERVYGRRAQMSHDETWLAVRVGHGRAAIEGLYIGGRPIEDVVREQLSSRSEPASLSDP